MVNLKQKNQLAKLLSKLGDNSYDTHNVIDEILLEIESIKQSIQKPIDLSSINNDVSSLSGKYESMAKAVSEISLIIESLKNSITKESKSSDESLSDFISDTLVVLDELETEIEILKDVAFKDKGGSAHRLIAINNVVVATKYVDINLVSSGGVSVVATDNNITKRTDLTVGLGGGTIVNNVTPGGTLNQLDDFGIITEQAAMGKDLVDITDVPSKAAVELALQTIRNDIYQLGLKL